MLFFPDGEKTVNHSMWKEFKPQKMHAGWTGFSIFEKSDELLSAQNGDGQEFHTGYRRGSIAEKGQAVGSAVAKESDWDVTLAVACQPLATGCKICLRLRSFSSKA